jgi:hypothetical protein
MEDAPVRNPSEWADAPREFHEPYDARSDIVCSNRGRVPVVASRRGSEGCTDSKRYRNVLGGRRRPQSEELMVGIRECPPAADGDEPRVTVLGQDHGSIDV